MKILTSNEILASDLYKLKQLAALTKYVSYNGALALMQLI